MRLHVLLGSQYEGLPGFLIRLARARWQQGEVLT